MLNKNVLLVVDRQYHYIPEPETKLFKFTRKQNFKLFWPLYPCRQCYIFIPSVKYRMGSSVEENCCWQQKIYVHFNELSAIWWLWWWPLLSWVKKKMIWKFLNLCLFIRLYCVAVRHKHKPTFKPFKCEWIRKNYFFVTKYEYNNNRLLQWCFLSIIFLRILKE